MKFNSSTVNWVVILQLTGQLPNNHHITIKLWDDPGSGFALERPANIFGVGDQGLFAAILEEPDNGLDLRGHGTFGKVRAFGKISLGFGNGHLVDPFLLGFAKIESDLFHSRGND